MKHLKRNAMQLGLTTILILFALTSTGCQFSLINLPSLPGLPNNEATPEIPSGPTATPTPMAQVTFIAVLPEPLAEGESLAIAILDEITGLALNSQLYAMEFRDQQTYAISLPFSLNSIIKYRYIRRSNVQLQEDTGTDTIIRYRMYQVNGPGETRDIIASWIDRTYAVSAGSIEGEVYQEGGGPLANIMVTAGGEQTITDSAGRFDLEGLPPGTHNLVAYALDGTFQTFQQGATVLENLNTPVKLYLKPATTVNVTFNLTVPSNTLPGAPIRLGGNLFQLGNTFADLRGGLSTIADRMPTMTALPDGRYTISLRLPAGADVRYKYTLGDGFWNAEHKSTSEYVTRQLIIPQQDIVINELVESWQAGGSSAPIMFEVNVPPSTPAGDIIYIQFHPYGWTEPIPMWPIGGNRWVYKLYSPLSIINSLGYRYCRAGQCGSADDIATMGGSTSSRQVSTSLVPQDIKDTVEKWAWLEDNQPGGIAGTPVSVRQDAFAAGIELLPTQHPNWITSMPQALQNIQALGSNWVTLTPTWTYGTSSPLVLAPVPGKDSFWSDTVRMVTQAQALNMDAAIFPTPRFGTNADDFWASAPKNEIWWQTWFDHYQAFIINYADLASQSGANTLILGGEWVEPALPGGTIADGTTSGVPPFAETRWKTIIADVRTHFHGRVLWALPYEHEYVDTPLGFLTDIDGIYLLWSLELNGSSNPSKDDLTNEAGRLLDTNVSPLASLVGKPIIIAAAYPSANGSASGCLPDGRGGCLHWTQLSQPNPDASSVTLNLNLQADIYDSMLTAINQRQWVGGFVSRGYYPPTILQDKSASVHGKPAANVLWYWYPRLLGATQ